MQNPHVKPGFYAESNRNNIFFKKQKRAGSKARANSFCTVAHIQLTLIGGLDLRSKGNSPFSLRFNCTLISETSQYKKKEVNRSAVSTAFLYHTVLLHDKEMLL